MTTEAHEGGCHCGRVRFRVQGELKNLVECNCSICRKKGFIHFIVPAQHFELLSGADDLQLYQFNTRIAKHQFCKHCGIHSHYVPRSDPDKIDVNVRCLDDVDWRRLIISQFDGENWEKAIAGDPVWRR